MNMNNLKKTLGKNLYRKNNLNYFIIIFLGVIIISSFLFRFILPKNIWVCQKGEWIKQGSPLIEKPDSICVLE
jgi:hypothetical protein